MGMQWNNFIGGTSLVCVMHEWNARFWITGLLYHFPDKLGVQGKRGGSRGGSKVKKIWKNCAKKIAAYILVSELLGNKYRVKRGISAKKKLQFYCLTNVDHLYFHKYLF